MGFCFNKTQTCLQFSIALDTVLTEMNLTMTRWTERTDVQGMIRATI
jgi:hypothetical protein